MKTSGKFLFHPDKKLLEYAHPTGTVWICAGAPETTEARAFEWHTDDLIPHERTGERGRPGTVVGARAVHMLQPNTNFVDAINRIGRAYDDLPRG